MYSITTPVSQQVIDSLHVGDILSLSGDIFCGRDAALPQLVKLCSEGRLGELGIDLAGSLIFHTAVSPAGIGPTSSNKLEIESSIAPLSAAGVKIHLGKGAISQQTVAALDRYHSICAVIPPVTALLQSSILSSEVVAFPEEGMEALYRLRLSGITMIVAAAHGQAIYEV